MQMRWQVKISRIKKTWADEEYREDLKAELIDQVGYFIEPQDLFSAMIREMKRKISISNIWRRQFVKLKHQH